MEPEKDHNYWMGELQKCMSDQYYFYVNYTLVNGEKPAMTREEYYDRLNSMKNYTPFKRRG